MPITKATVDTFVEVLDAVQTALAYFEVPEKPGIAMAKGTLIARTNAVRLIAAQLETREANPSDTQAFISTLSTLNWLATDKDAVRDFVDVDLPMPAIDLAKDRPDLVEAGTFSYDKVIAMPIRALESLILVA